MIAMDVSPARSAVRIRLFYFIEILHQTTTIPMRQNEIIKLYLIEILHQTTTLVWGNSIGYCCILLKFYIKPQPIHGGINAKMVVSY